MSNSATFETPHVPSIVPILNPLIRRLVGAGMPFGPNVLFTVRGRTSGVPRTFPVALIEYEGRRYVQSPFGEVNWVRNLRASGEATITKGRSREDVAALELTPDEAGLVLHAAVTPYQRSRIGAAMVKWLFHIERDATVEDFLAAAQLHPTFELRAKE